jgi:hypothetical protein
VAEAKAILTLAPWATHQHQLIVPIIAVQLKEYIPILPTVHFCNNIALYFSNVNDPQRN